MLSDDPAHLAHRVVLALATKRVQLHRSYSSPLGSCALLNDEKHPDEDERSDDERAYEQVAKNFGHHRHQPRPKSLMSRVVVRAYSWTSGINRLATH
ncbi:hypothetical protein QF026_004795 [Streptomyces aurantiacus]|nr:hypothetical protein [Streptomyces aurantiacus]